MRHKRPAEVSIGIDADPAVVDRWSREQRRDGLTVINGDATRYLSSIKFETTDFIYIDPPYLPETRKSGPLYNFEMTREDHVALLEVIRPLPAKVMISGYWSSLYSESLAGWNTYRYIAQTRQGTAEEWVWFNYPVPDRLHDYSFIGNDYRERERIKRKRDRWMRRLSSLPVLERRAIIQGLQLLDPPSAIKGVGLENESWG